MLEYGLRKGLAQDMQYDSKINDLRYNEQANKQAKMMAEKESALFADDFEYNNAVNQFDNPKIKAFSQAKIKEIGAFVNSNPDWKTNVGKRAQYKQLVHELKDNPDLNRGMLSDANMSSYNKDLSEKSKNPDLFDDEAWKGVEQERQNYVRFGNQYATDEASAQKLGVKEFQYNRPKDFINISEAGLDLGGKFHKFKMEAMPGGGFGSYKEVVDEDSLTVTATDHYLRNKRQFDKQAAVAGYGNGFLYAKESIRPGIKAGKFDYGEDPMTNRIAMARLNQENNPPPPGLTTYEIDFVGKDASMVPGEVLKEAFGAKPSFKLKNNNGTKFVNITNSEVDYTGRNAYFGNGKKDGIRDVEVVGRMTPDEARAEGILSNNYIFDDEIASEWKGIAYLKTSKNKKGDDVEYVEYLTTAQFEVNNPTAAGVYNAKTSASKYQQAPKSNYQQKQRVGTYEGGDKWILNEKNEPVAPYNP